MPFITETRSDTELLVQLPNFLTQTSANATELGVTPAQIEELSDNITLFTTDMENVVAKKAAAKAAVTAKNASRSTIKAQIGAFAKTWRANVAVSDETLSKLNVPPHATAGTQTPPVTPTELSYSINTENAITLRWKRNGNKSGTIFNVESSSNGVSGWSVVRTTTATKAALTGTPGVSVWLRVVAIRGESSATPTNPVVIWPTAPESFQLIAA